MSSSYNTPWIKHELIVSIYSNTETSLAMSTLAINYGLALSNLAMSGLAFSVAQLTSLYFPQQRIRNIAGSGAVALTAARSVRNIMVTNIF